MLTHDQITFYRANGYLVVDDLLDQAMVLDPVRREYQALLDDLLHRSGLAGETAGQSFSEKLTAAYRTGLDWFQSMDISLPGDRIHAQTPMHFGPAVFDMITAKPLLDLVADLIGPEITSNPIQHVRIKPPQRQLQAGEIRAHVGGTDWHQDRAVALEDADRTKMVTIWIAVTKAMVENGCLQVARRKPETILPHCPKAQTSIADHALDTSDALALPVRSGGVLVLDPMLPHASLPNMSNNIRWSFDLRYNQSGQPTGRSHFPEFVARSPAHPETELHDWRVWRDMWRDTRARLAQKPHINIHRWRSDAPACA